MSTVQSRHGWRIATASLSILLLLTFGLYHNTVLYLIDLWNQLTSGEYGHGYLVLAISAYLVVRKRRVIAALTPCPDYRVSLAVLAFSLLWLLAVLVDVQVLQVVSLLLLVLAIIWTMLGSQVTRKLLFPVLFITLALPVWYPLAPLLQDLTANAVFSMIRVLGLPAFRQENLIVLPAGTLSITEACSGLRYLLAGLTLGTLYAYLNYATIPSRMAVVLVTVGAAVLANILRVFIVVYLGYATEMQHSLVSDHLNLGWVLFGALVIVLLIIDVRLYRYHNPKLAGKETVTGSIEPDCPGQGGRQYTVLLFIAALLVSTGPVAVYMVDNKTGQMSGTVELELPAGTGGWTGPVDSKDDWMPEYHGAVNYKQTYLKGSDSVSLFVGVYPVQQQGKELINDLNRIANRKVWHSVYPRGRLRKTGDQDVLEQLLEKKNGEQRLVWYWYSVAGRHTTSEYRAKVLQVLGLFTGNSQASVIAVAVDSGEDITNARRILGDYLSAMHTDLATLVEGKPD